MDEEIRLAEIEADLRALYAGHFGEDFADRHGKAIRIMALSCRPEYAPVGVFADIGEAHE